MFAPCKRVTIEVAIVFAFNLLDKRSPSPVMNFVSTKRLHQLSGHESYYILINQISSFHMTDTVSDLLVSSSVFS